MAGSAIACHRCKTTLRVPDFPWEELPKCPSCGTRSGVLAFPALLRPPVAAATGDAALSDEAACFYHPGRKASIVCDACGRFLCELCDVELQGQHLCAGCLAEGRRKSKFKDLETQRMRYDVIAIQLALLPLVIMPFIIFTAVTGPAAVFCAFRYWKKMEGVLGPVKIRMAVALLVGLGETGVWIFILSSALARMFVAGG